MPSLATIESACELVTDGTHYTPKDVGEGIPFLTVKDVSDLGLDFVGCSYITDSDYRDAASGNSAPKKGDVLFSKDGTVGKVHVVASDKPFAVLSSLAILRPKKDSVDPTYLGHALRSPDTLNEALKKKTGSAIRRIILSDLKRVRIYLPPLPEQRRIAAILDQADALRAKRREALAQLNSLTQSIFIEMFGEALGSNTRLALSHYIEEFRYGTSNKSGANGYPALRIPNVTSGSLDLTELKTVEVDDSEFQRLKLCDGDLLFVRTNGNPDNVGRCAVFNPLKVFDSGFDSSEFIYASYLIRARMKQSTILPVVLQQYLSAGEGRQALRARSKTSAGQFNINTEGLGTLPIPNFPMHLQKAFIGRKKTIEQQQSIQQKSLSKLDTLFASLQHSAFQGEL